MPSRFPRVSRRSRVVVVSAVGLAFAAVAGVGLAQVTAGSSNEAASGHKVKPTTTVTITTTTPIGTISTITVTTTIPVTTTISTSTSLPTPPTTSLPTLPTTAPIPGTTSTASNKEGQAKVTICHHTHSKKHPFHTITVAAPAVQSHITNHGDTPGSCPVTTTTTPATQAATTTSTPKTKKPKKHPQPQLLQAPKAAKTKHTHISHLSSKPKSSNHGQSKKAQSLPQTHGNGGGQGNGGGKNK
jgi:hypothetical protein